MITPKEIEEKEFSKAVRGYNCIEVDSFLDEIISDLEKLLLEKEAMRLEIEKLRKEVEQNKKSETTVMNTLESAKKLMKDISESAERRAEIIIKNATLDAAVMQRDARDSISKLSKQKDDLEDRLATFKARYKDMLEEELANLDEFGSDILSDIDEGDALAGDLDKKDEIPAAQVKTEEQSQEDIDALAEAIFSDMNKQREKTADETKVNLDKFDLDSLTNSNGAKVKDDRTRVDLKSAETAYQSRPASRDSVFAPKDTVVIDSKAIDELIKKEEEKLKR